MFKIFRSSGINYLRLLSQSYCSDNVLSRRLMRLCCKSNQNKLHLLPELPGAPALKRHQNQTYHPTVFTLPACSMSSGDSITNINYEQLIDLKDKEDVYLIDVRERHELRETGEIPGSFNIPVGELSDALGKLSDDSFERKYGFDKPSCSNTLIFSCRTGKRSLMALDKALKAGYENSLNFTGGWEEWERNNA